MWLCGVAEHRVENDTKLFLQLIIKNKCEEQASRRPSQLNPLNPNSKSFYVFKHVQLIPGFDPNYIITNSCSIACKWLFLKPLSIQFIGVLPMKSPEADH